MLILRVSRLIRIYILLLGLACGVKLLIPAHVSVCYLPSFDGGSGIANISFVGIVAHHENIPI